MIELTDSGRRLYRDRGIPSRYVELLCTGHYRENTEAMTQAREWYESPSERWLLLSGEPGCGKSVAAAWCVAMGTPDPYPGGYEPSRCRAPGCWPWDLAPRFVSCGRLANLAPWDDELERLSTCSLLAIDDLGTEQSAGKLSDRFLSVLDGLAVRRHNDELRTVITMNLGLSNGEFSRRYGERLIDRVRECGRPYELSSKSMRGKAAPK